MKKILAFVGSNSTTSINMQLVNNLAELASVDIEVVSVGDFDLPLFSVDLEKAGIPASVQALNAEFEHVDGYILATPEYNSSIPGYLKNAFDWLSRVEKKVFRNKPVLLTCASNGGRAGASVRQHLERVLPFWGASQVINHGFGNATARRNEDGTINEADQEMLRGWLTELESSL